MKSQLTFLNNIVNRNFRVFFKFGVVGLTGTIINFCVYYYAHNKFNISLNSCALLAFCFAVVNNYLLNHFWTFRSNNAHEVLSFKNFLLYVLVNLKGLGINLLVLNLTVLIFGLKFHVIGQLAGIGLGVLSNFIYSKKIVFRKALVN